MKKLILFAAIIGIVWVSSCSKQGTTNVRTNYTCTCWWLKSPGHDTTAQFTYKADTGQAKAQSACTSKDTWVKGMSGVNSGANCRFE